ncbi:hypothetical protein M405DRAFT_189771 [Rhizopogon salebrosus TDB-379]|nr:hypothetical protein M405DRAFT_189771 [Rhizopogon salebrosus TDB-379]
MLALTWSINWLKRSTSACLSYPALFERATSDPSQSRRRGLHQPSMETSKPKSSLRRPRFPLACTARQEHRDAVRGLHKPEEEDMSPIHGVA